jgi:hypothetical protein
MAWSCDQCGRNVVSNELMCDLCMAARPGADPQRIELARQRDLVMEAHLRALGLWYRIGAVLFTVGALISMVGGGALAFGFGRMSGVVAGALLFGLAFTVVICGGAYVLGHFLARYYNGARITAAVLSCVGLAWMLLSFGLVLFASERGGNYYGGDPYGIGHHYYSRSSGVGFLQVIFMILAVVWMISVLWALFNGRSATICSPRYRDLAARTPELRPSTFKSPFFIVPLAVLCFLFLVMMVAIVPRL